MPITSRIDSSRDLTIHTAKGDVSIDEIMEKVEALYGSSHRTLNVLWDFRNAALSRIPSEDIRSLIDLAEPHRKIPRKGGKTAIVVQTAVDFGLSRMYENLADRLPHETMVFQSMEEALHWISGDE
jgi:hypothetical protein